LLVLLGLVWAASLSVPAGYAQAVDQCTTQAKMPEETRTTLVSAAMGLAEAVKAGDVVKVKTGTVTELAAGFDATATLVRVTSGELANDSLQATQVYALDARGRREGDPTEADFSCPLTGTTAETDFAIPALPPGMYGFVMVEATGARPWLLSFLLEQVGGAWKMAGFYPRARTAAGHDGLWYWKAGRDDQKTKEAWLSWLMYGEADQLLRPANFVTSSNLDKLRGEQRTAAPAELSDGIGKDTPLVVKAADGTLYRVTALSGKGSEDGRRLELTLRYEATSLTDATAEKARNLAVAKALLDAHKELRQGFDGVEIFADMPGQAAFFTSSGMADLR
jgi:hypothetical protein